MQNNIKMMHLVLGCSCLYFFNNATTLQSITIYEFESTPFEHSVRDTSLGNKIPDNYLVIFDAGLLKPYFMEDVWNWCADLLL